jgi:hypothetical protein
MDKQTQEIPRDDWAGFAEQFSRQYGGATATLEALGSDSGDQYAAENLPFVGMTLESKGSDAGALTLMLGTEGPDHLERLITAPQSLRVHTNPSTGETTLEIEASEEPKLLLHLTPITALPAP